MGVTPGLLQGEVVKDVAASTSVSGSLLVVVAGSRPPCHEETQAPRWRGAEVERR